MKYLAVDYMYRSGSNWKTFATIYFKMENEDNKEQLIEKIETILGEHFIARQVDFPEIFDWTGDPLDDHCYHEVRSVYTVDFLKGELHPLNAEAFIERYQDIKWEWFNPLDISEGVEVA